MNKISVLHIIDSAGLAGGERYLFDLIRHAGQAFRHEVLLSQEGLFQIMLEKAGFPWRRVNMKKRFDLRSVQEIRKTIIRGSVDIVHTHGYRAGLYGRTALLGLAVPAVTTVHVSLYDYVDTPPLMRRIYMLMERMFSHKSRLFICISRAMETDMKRMGIPEKRLTVIPNGVDTGLFFPRPPDPRLKHELGLDGPGPVIGTVGRMVTEKGQVHLLEALAGIVSRWKTLKCLFAGDGPLKAELIERTGRLGIRQACRFIGPRTDMERIYPLLDVFVLPSRREPFGLALLEAMACGVPVIATDAGGPRDFIAHGQQGLLVKPESPRDLAAGVEYLLDNSSVARELSRQARENVQNNYNIMDTVKSIEACYLSLLEPNSGEGRSAG